MEPLVQVAAFDGKGSPSVDYEQRVRLWGRTAEVDPSRRASTLYPRMDTIARRICLDAGGDTFPQGEDADTISETLRNYCRPDTIDYVYQQITKFSRYKRTDQTVERRRLDFDVLRHDAEARVITGGSFLDRSVSIFARRMRPRREMRNRFSSQVSIWRRMSLLRRNQCVVHLKPAAALRDRMFLQRRIALWNRNRKTCPMKPRRLRGELRQRGGIPPEGHVVSRVRRIK